MADKLQTRSLHPPSRLNHPPYLPLCSTPALAPLLLIKRHVLNGDTGKTHFEFRKGELVPIYGTLIVLLSLLFSRHGTTGVAVQSVDEGIH